MLISILFLACAPGKIVIFPPNTDTDTVGSDSGSGGPGGDSDSDSGGGDSRPTDDTDGPDDSAGSATYVVSAEPVDMPTRTAPGGTLFDIIVYNGTPYGLDATGLAWNLDTNTQLPLVTGTSIVGRLWFPGEDGPCAQVGVGGSTVDTYLGCWSSDGGTVSITRPAEETCGYGRGMAGDLVLEAGSACFGSRLWRGTTLAGETCSTSYTDCGSTIARDGEVLVMGGGLYAFAYTLLPDEAPVLNYVWNTATHVRIEPDALVPSSLIGNAEMVNINGEMYYLGRRWDEVDDSDTAWHDGHAIGPVSSPYWMEEVLGEPVATTKEGTIAFMDWMGPEGYPVSVQLTSSCFYESDLRIYEDDTHPGRVAWACINTNYWGWVDLTVEAL